MTIPTKSTETIYTYNENGAPLSMTEESYEPKCSVELGEAASGKPVVKSVKVYAATGVEAAALAIATFNNLRAELFGTVPVL